MTLKCNTQRARTLGASALTVWLQFDSDYSDGDEASLHFFKVRTPFLQSQRPLQDTANFRSRKFWQFTLKRKTFAIKCSDNYNCVSAFSPELNLAIPKLTSWIKATQQAQQGRDFLRLVSDTSSSKKFHHHHSKLFLTADSGIANSWTEWIVQVARAFNRSCSLGIDALKWQLWISLKKLF